VTYRGLGFDPTPGSVDAVAQTVAQLRAAVDAMAAVEPALRAAERHSQSWEGAAAESFRGRLTVPAVESAPLRAAIPVLERWASTLAANRRRTEELDATAVRLRRRLDDARDLLQDKQNALDLAATPTAAAGASIEVSGATSRVAELAAELADVVDQARTLEREHLRAADDAAAELAVDPTPRAERPAIRALAGVLGRASQTSAALAGLLARGTGAPPSPTVGTVGTVAAAVSRSAPAGGELIVFGETTLPVSGS